MFITPRIQPLDQHTLIVRPLIKRRTILSFQCHHKTSLLLQNTCSFVTWILFCSIRRVENEKQKNIRAVQYLNHLLWTLTASCTELRCGGLTRFLKEHSDIFISPWEARAPAASLLLWKKTSTAATGKCAQAKEIFASSLGLYCRWQRF